MALGSLDWVKTNLEKGCPTMGVKENENAQNLVTNSERILARRCRPRWGWGVGVDQGRPFEVAFLALARSGRRRMSHPAHPGPRLLGSPGGRNGKPRDLDGHDCRRRDPSNRDAPTASLARGHVLRTLPPKITRTRD